MRTLDRFDQDSHLPHSSAGKSQLCMQISLSVQLPRSRGGIGGGACFLSTSWTLAAYSKRMAQIINGNPNLSTSQCDLSAIKVISTPSVAIMTHVLTKEFPELVEIQAKQPFAKPIKLLIIDALAGLFHLHPSVSSEFLKERSSQIAEISMLLHRLISKYGIAVVVVNEVVDVFDRVALKVPSHEVLYRDQDRFFNRPDFIPGEDKKQAALGLSWSNHINARIMLSRTSRMRYLEQSEVPAKRRKLNSGEAEPREDQPTLIRRLTVIFNPLAPPASVDYIMTNGGIVVLPTEDASSFATEEAVESPPQAPVLPANTPVSAMRVSPSDIPPASSQPSSYLELPSDEYEGSQPAPVAIDAEDGPQEAEDEWEDCWRRMDAQLGSDFLTYVDTDHPTSSASPVRALG